MSPAGVKINRRPPRLPLNRPVFSGRPPPPTSYKTTKKSSDGERDVGSKPKQCHVAASLLPSARTSAARRPSAPAATRPGSGLTPRGGLKQALVTRTAAVAKCLHKAAWRAASSSSAARRGEQERLQGNASGAPEARRGRRRGRKGRRVRLRRSMHFLWLFR
jgi:hypothetical protein